MTIFYVDLINGNDANTGLSWAQAWKTSASGPTAARTVPGDTFRFAKSPDPTAVGTATWTNRKIGNSITFDTAPTTYIANGVSGWVTSSTTTVTNNQTTAHIINGAVSCVTSADTALMYKPLGSAIDFSAHQQVNFWFRPAAAFDCTGAQNMTIQLCSDTLGATVVDSLVIPKWNYSANVWYPLVIDKGSALGASIQSISIVTTSATTATFYFDEFFASPAGGITLQSLIGKYTSSATEEYDWFPIKTIRNGDVWLHGGMYLSTAIGACNSSSLDPSYVGTTETVTTYKRECVRPLISSGPNATSIISTNEAGTVSMAPSAALYTWSGGWDTGTTIQNGETWFDMVAQLGPGITTGHAYNQFERFGVVRSAAFFATSNFTNFKDMSAVGCTTLVTTGTQFDLRKQISVEFNFKCIIGCGSALTLGASNLIPGSKINVGNMWGNGPLSVTGFNSTVITIGNVISVGATSNTVTTYNNINAVLNFGNMEPCRTTALPNGAAMNFLLGVGADYRTTYNVSSLNNASMSTSAACLSIGSAVECVANIASFNSTGYAATVTAPNSLVINGGIINTSMGGGIFTTSAGPVTTPLVFHNYNNTNGLSRVYFAHQGVSGFPYWELQGVDVRTPGSKAWKTSITGLPLGPVGNNYDVAGARNDLKLASVAAVGGSLVTVDCYVKRSNANQTVGIYVAGATKFLPGYTADIVDTVTTTGAFELCTVTFTPTADCVFDVYAFVTYTSSGSIECTFDDLSITQAA